MVRVQMCIPYACMRSTALLHNAALHYYSVQPRTTCCVYRHMPTGVPPQCMHAEEGLAGVLLLLPSSMPFPSSSSSPFSFSFLGTLMDLEGGGAGGGGGDGSLGELYRLPPEVQARVDEQYRRDILAVHGTGAAGEQDQAMDLEYSSFFAGLGGQAPTYEELIR